MQAIVLKGFGGIENLVLKDLPEPELPEGEVLLEVKAISINPVDVKTRAGKGQAERLKTEDPIILGWDVSGTVRESKSALFKTGDEVFGMVRFPGHGKVYAKYVTAPEGHLALKPARVSHTEAAAACLAALTAWQALSLARVIPGWRVLIHAASGGVGHYAVQEAKYLGAYVIGTSSAANRDFVLGLGADEHIDYQGQRLEDAVRHVDFVLDTIGGENIDRSLKVMRQGGTIISIPSGLNGAVAEKARVKGMNGHATYVRSSGDDMRQIAALLDQGALKSFISQVFAFADMGQAHLQIESGRTRGKIALDL
jgi:NADPH:quinone reductase-like Zn-dependent oxidoreductase